MALFSQVGTIICPAAPGAQVIPLPFEAKAIFFWGSATTAGNGISSNYQASIGGATILSGGRTSGTFPTGVNYTPNPNYITGGFSQILVRGGTQAAPTTVMDGNLTAVSPTDFTITWTAVTSGREIHYLALGGDDLSTFHQDITIPTAAGNFSSTGVPFPPLGGYCMTFVGNSMFDGPGGFGAHFNCVGTEPRIRQANNTTLIYVDASRDESATVVSLNADGVTFNKAATVGVNALRTFYFGGNINFHCFSFNSITGNGSQIISGLPFRPNTLVFNTMNKVANNSLVTGESARPSVGIVDQAGSQQAIAGLIRHTTPPPATTATSTYQNNASVIEKINDAGVVTARASFVDYTNDGFELNWTANDGIAKEVIVTAWGEIASSSAPKRLMMMGVGA